LQEYIVFKQSCTKLSLHEVGATVVNSSATLTEAGQELLDGEVAIVIHVQGVKHSLKLLRREGNLAPHSLSTHKH